MRGIGGQETPIELIDVGKRKAAEGDRTGALEAYEKALTVARPLAATDASPEKQWDLQLALQRIGEVKIELGDFAGARIALDESVAIARPLARSSPGNADWQYNLQVALQGAATARERSGDNTGALGDLAEALAVARAMPDSNRPTQWQWNLAYSLDRLGDIKAKLGDNTAALSAYDESVVLERRVVGVVSDDASTQASLAESLYKIALIADGEKRNAALDEAIGIVERLDAAGTWPADKKDLKENLFALRTPSQASQP